MIRFYFECVCLRGENGHGKKLRDYLLCRLWIKRKFLFTEWMAQINSVVVQCAQINQLNRPAVSIRITLLNSFVWIRSIFFFFFQKMIITIHECELLRRFIICYFSFFVCVCFLLCVHWTHNIKREHIAKQIPVRIV